MRWWKAGGIGVLVALAGAALVVLVQQPRPATLCDQVDDDDFSIVFGLSREPITRSVALLAPSDPTDVDAAAAREVTATLEGDLVRDGTVATFPADQITVSAKVNSDDRTVDVRAVVDPSGAAPVPEGCYRGHLTVYRNGAEPRRRDVVVDIADREKWSAVVAVAVLLIGALVGLAIKWITESLTPLAEARRRFGRSRNLLANKGYTDNDLPRSLRTLRDEVEQHLRHQEITDLKDKFRQLETAIDLAEPAIAVIHEIRAHLDRQRGELERLWRAGLPDHAVTRLANLLQSEINQLNDLRNRPWTTQAGAARIAETNRLRNHVEVVNNFMAVYPDYAGQDHAETVADDIGRLLANNNVKGAAASLNTLVGPTSRKNTGENREKRTGSRLWPKDVESPRQKTARDTWLIRNARLIAALVSALVVTVVGFSVEYLDNRAFEDNMDDWLGLFLWAAVVQLSGVSVLDVVAKLSAGAQPRLS